jgi:hypothetical protein
VLKLLKNRGRNRGKTQKQLKSQYGAGWFNFSESLN